METDQLIRTLAADNAHRARPVGFVLALALLAAVPVSVAMFFAELGVRPDVMTAMRNPFFDLKFAVTLALAISAIAVSLHLSRPEASLRGFGWMLLVPAGLLVAGISGEMMMPQRLPMMTRLMGRNSMVCLTAIPAMSLPLLAAALFGLRHRAAAPAAGRRAPPPPDWCRRVLRRRCTPRTAPTIHRCSWRPGTRSPPRWSPPSARWRDRGCCGFDFSSSRRTAGGTHTPCRRDEALGERPSATINSGGYGPRRTPGPR